jgi:hypothetical protein
VTDETEDEVEEEGVPKPPMLLIIGPSPGTGGIDEDEL